MYTARINLDHILITPIIAALKYYLITQTKYYNILRYSYHGPINVIVFNDLKNLSMLFFTYMVSVIKQES
jgi:hypothetical protein